MTMEYFSCELFVNMAFQNGQQEIPRKTRFRTTLLLMLLIAIWLNQKKNHLCVFAPQFYGFPQICFLPVHFYLFAQP